MTSRSKKNWATLPLSRVKTIMRSSPEVSSISPDAIALTAHSAELFISQLVKDALIERNERKERNDRSSSGKSKLEYQDLSQVVATSDRMAFLQDILPNKIKVKDYRHMMAQIQEQRQRQREGTDGSGSDNEG